MVKRNVLIRKIEAIEKHIVKAALYKSLSYAAFKSHPEAQDIVSFNLFQAINSLISMMEHIVVDEGYGLPESAYHAAELLRQKRILGSKDLETIRRMVGFRNVIAHQYTDIDTHKVYLALTEGSKDIVRLVKKLGKYFKVY